MTTKCDIIRDFMHANSCGYCTALANGSAPSTSCNVTDSNRNKYDSACLIPGMANGNMALLSLQYSPKNLIESATDKLVRTKKEQTYLTGIKVVNDRLKLAYQPLADNNNSSIKWSDMQLCLQDKNEVKVPKYYSRTDIVNAGMNPKSEYPIGGTTLNKTIWKDSTKLGPLPVIVDNMMNPDLFTIIMFAFVMIIFTVLMMSIAKTKKMEPYLNALKHEKELDKLEKDSPYKNSAFSSYYGTMGKCRQIILNGEAQGRDMTLYRKRCNMAVPPT